MAPSRLPPPAIALSSASPFSASDALPPDAALSGQSSNSQGAGSLPPSLGFGVGPPQPLDSVWVTPSWPQQGPVPQPDDSSPADPDASPVGSSPPIDTYDRRIPGTDFSVGKFWPVPIASSPDEWTAPPNLIAAALDKAWEAAESGADWAVGLPGRVLDRYLHPEKRLKNGPKNAANAAAALFGGMTLRGPAVSPPVLPEYDGKTSDVLITNDGRTVVLRSGAADGYSNYPAARHVEGKAAFWMRENDASDGTVYHNNPKGTCPMCDSNLPTFLPEGTKLWVVPPADAASESKRWITIPKPYTGNTATPLPPD
jgi:SCP1.201-like deaminase